MKEEEDECQKCQVEIPDGLKCCIECGADGWVAKAEKELATLS